MEVINHHAEAAYGGGKPPPSPPAKSHSNGAAATVVTTPSGYYIDVPTFFEYAPDVVGAADEYCTVAALAKRLEAEIRAAKRTHLSCGEVLLPSGLLQKTAADIFAVAHTEPKGLRACTILLLFEGEEDCRRLSTFTVDPTTPSTCEIYLTFKQANAGWTFLPQFLKKITRGGTVVISTDYELTRKKLYRNNNQLDL